MTSFMETFDKAGDIMASLQSPGEPFYITDLPRMSFSVGKIRPDRDIHAHNTSSDRGSISLPQGMNPLPEAATNSCVQLQVGTK